MSQQLPTMSQNSAQRMCVSELLCDEQTVKMSLGRKACLYFITALINGRTNKHCIRRPEQHLI